MSKRISINTKQIVAFLLFLIGFFSLYAKQVCLERRILNSVQQPFFKTNILFIPSDKGK